MTHCKGLRKHILRAKSCKTVCVSNVLAYFGVTPDMYTVTSTRKDVHAYRNVLRRNGRNVRSRASHTKKAKTVGQLRAVIRDLAAKETEDVKGYMVLVDRHLIALDCQGNTVIDTAPRKADRRKVLAVHAII